MYTAAVISKEKINNVFSKGKIVMAETVIRTCPNQCDLCMSNV